MKGPFAEVWAGLRELTKMTKHVGHRHCWMLPLLLGLKDKESEWRQKIQYEQQPRRETTTTVLWPCVGECATANTLQSGGADRTNTLVSLSSHPPALSSWWKPTGSQKLREPRVVNLLQQEREKPRIDLERKREQPAPDFFNSLIQLKIWKSSCYEATGRVQKQAQ